MNLIIKSKKFFKTLNNKIANYLENSYFAVKYEEFIEIKTLVFNR